MAKKITKRLAFIISGIWLLKKIANCNNINSVNPLYLMVDNMIGHCEEKRGNKYLVLDDVDQNNKFWRNMKKFGRVLKKKLKPLMVAKKIEYDKDLKKIKFQSNEDLPLNKTIKLRLLTIIIRSVISENGKFYPKLFLDEALYELV